MAMDTIAKRRRRTRLGEEEEELVDRISSLPDNVLGDIISLLPTKDGGRTQVLSSPLWRSAPLNLGPDPDVHDTGKHPFAADISRILSTHQGPGRRFCALFSFINRDDRFATLDRWLRSPALDNLQELEFDHGIVIPQWRPTSPPPASVTRFSSTLRVASFAGCGFPDGNGGVLHLPVLKQLTLYSVIISESYLNALLLAGCPVLESLMLADTDGCSRVRIVSHTLRSIGVCHSTKGQIKLQQLIIEDAPCLERLLPYENYFSMEITISVISAPKLHVLALPSAHKLRLEFVTTVFQGLHIVSFMKVVNNMKVLALTQMALSLDVFVDIIKCFPCLEKLYIKTEKAGEKNLWHHKYKNLIGTLEIRLKKIVLRNYRGNRSHVNFAKFFVLNARRLESMRFELLDGSPSNAWIERQHRLLQIKTKASRDVQFDFVSNNRCRLTLRVASAEQVHDLSTAGPFVRFHDWT